MTTDQWIDRLETRLAAPDHKERGRAPEPRFHTYLENLGWIQLFNYSINRFHTDPAFNLETQIRQKIFHLDHFNDDSTFGMDVSASLGMYFEYTLVGIDVQHQDDGVPNMAHHPLQQTPDLRLLKRHDYRTSGVMPAMFRLRDALQALAKGRLSVSLPRWDRGPLDLAIQLRGYDNFVGDTMDRPEFVHALMRFLIEERIRWWDAYLADTGATDKAAMIADDWINIPFISPAMFEEFVLPYYLELERYHGRTPYIHSCGDKVPVQKMLLRIKTLDTYEVNHWTSLEGTLANLPADKFLSISILNSEVLLSDEAKMRRELERIATACRGRRYSVCAQAIEKLHTDMNEDISQVQRWLRVAREVLRPTK